MERENALRQELIETKSALERSRSAQALLRQQLRSANNEHAANLKSATDRVIDGKSGGRRGGGWNWAGGEFHDAEISASVNPDGSCNVIGDQAFESDRSDDDTQTCTPKPSKVPARQVKSATDKVL